MTGDKNSEVSSYLSDQKWHKGYGLVTATSAILKAELKPKLVFSRAGFLNSSPRDPQQVMFLEYPLGFKYQAFDMDLKHLCKIKEILKTRPVVGPEDWS